MIPLLLACAPDPLSPEARALLEAMVLDPTALPPGESPWADDPAVAAFGRKMYATKAFAEVDNGRAVSCDSCHDLCADADCEALDLAGSGADPAALAVSQGAAGFTARNTPSVVNVVFRERFGWAGQFDTLHAMIEFPFYADGAFAASAEGTECTLNVETIEGVVAGQFLAPFEAAFGDVPVEFARVIDALEAALRTAVSPPSALDRYLAGEGDLADDALRGAALFVGKAHCVECHDGPLLSDGEQHDVGIFAADPVVVSECPPPGREDWRTPSLRRIARTAPYMHDGSLGTLWEVIAHYDALEQRDGRAVGPLGLTEGEKRDLEAFLRDALDDAP